LFECIESFKNEVKRKVRCHQEVHRYRETFFSRRESGDTENAEGRMEKQSKGSALARRDEGEEGRFETLRSA
jgi:hypothetical protein